MHVQVSRLEQRIHAVTADNETLQSELDGARRDADRARDTAASTSAGEGLARLPRDKWPLPVLMLVQAAETAAVADIKEQHVSTEPTCKLSCSPYLSSDKPRSPATFDSVCRAAFLQRYLLLSRSPHALHSHAVGRSFLMLAHLLYKL